MATYQKFNQTIADVFNGVHDFSTDTLKVMLTNTAPVAGDSVKADLVEITAENGYVAGGPAMAVTSSTQTGGTYSLVPTADVVITASGGSYGPFRYAVMYNSAPVADNLISYYDYGSSISVNDGENLTLDVQATLLTAT